jgi:Big-like domain-containing protein
MSKRSRRFVTVLAPICVAAVCVLWAAAAGAQQRGAIPPNAPPSVTAFCDPCTVEAGKTSAIHAYAKDPNRKQLTIKWTAKAGTFTDANARETVWTAPAKEGEVDLTVTADNGTGQTATNTITITVRASNKT